MYTIIIEGPDGAGKTTLINALFTNRKNTLSVHAKRPSSDNYAEYFTDIIYDAKRVGCKLLVFDRAWYSELVYADIMGRDVRLTTQQVHALEDTAINCGDAMLIYLDASDEVLIKRCFEERGEDYVNKEQLVAAAGAYRKLFSSDNPNKPRIRMWGAKLS